MIAACPNGGGGQACTDTDSLSEASKKKVTEEMVAKNGIVLYAAFFIA